MPPGNLNHVVLAGPAQDGARPCGPRPAQGPLASDAACGHTVRSHSHGPNVMIIGWPGVPVLRASQACPSQLELCYGLPGAASWWHGVAERSVPGFKSSSWFMFSRLKGLGTSSSHAGGSSSDGRGLTVTFSLTSPGPAESTSRHRDSRQPSSLIQ